MSVELENAATYWIRQTSWNVFGTLTSRGSESCAASFSRYLTLERVWRKYYPGNRAVWILRKEYGEIGGRRHFHFLLGCQIVGSPLFLAARLRLFWMRHGGGWSRTRPYKPDAGPDSACDYIMKGIDLSRANFYEGGKFISRGDDGLLFSRSFWTVNRGGCSRSNA